MTLERIKVHPHHLQSTSLLALSPLILLLRRLQNRIITLSHLPTMNLVISADLIATIIIRRIAVEDVVLEDTMGPEEEAVTSTTPVDPLLPSHSISTP